MGVQEEIHEQIDINLSLLRANGHNIIFEQGMFRDRNQPGFERVGHSLLMLIDPSECKKSIPWPIFEPRIRLQFQRNFVKFIKDINKKHSEANIPEVTASNLQAPGGSNFLSFMNKLSFFPLQLDLIRISKPKEKEELLPRFPPTKNLKMQKLHLAILTGARKEAEAALEKIADYIAEAPEVLEYLNHIDDLLAKKQKELDDKLKAEVYSLDVDDEIKQRMLNIEDSEVMKDYNTRTQTKVSERWSASNKLSRYNSLLAGEVPRLLRTMHTHPPCLDGTHLSIAPSVSQLAGGSVYNDDGEVRLEALLRAGLAAARRLSPIDYQQSQLLDEVQALQEETNLLHWRLQEANLTLDTFCATNQTIVNKLQPVMYDQVKEKRKPEFFKYLRDQPPLQFVLPKSCTQKPTLTQERPRRLHSLLKRGHTVVCSIKMRRSPPRSIFRKPLPSTLTSSRSRRSMHFPDNRRLLDLHTPLVNHKLNPNHFLSTGGQAARSVLVAPSTSNSEEAQVDNGITPETGNRRSSISKLIARFKSIQKGMIENSEKST